MKVNGLQGRGKANGRYPREDIANLGARIQFCRWHTLLFRKQPSCKSEAGTERILLERQWTMEREPDTLRRRLRSRTDEWVR